MEANTKNKSINVLPQELLTEILVKVPIEQLVQDKTVCKLWNDIVSERSFKEYHFEISPATKCIYVPFNTTDHGSVELNAVSEADEVDTAAAAVTRIAPCPTLNDERSNSTFIFLGSCRGLLAVYQMPHLFLIWNPLTGFHRSFTFPSFAQFAPRTDCALFSDAFRFLFGFGYDPTRDDYVVVLDWAHERNHQEEDFGIFSFRSNLWHSLREDVVIPDRLDGRKKWAPSVFFNGAIHWLIHGSDDDDAAIFAFDTGNRTFSEIRVPEGLGDHYSCMLTVLGNCLALYHVEDMGDMDDMGGSSVIWVRRESNVHPSWISYEIPSHEFEPVYMSENRIIGFQNASEMRKYNVAGELLLLFSTPEDEPRQVLHAVYTESVFMLPNDEEEEGDQVLEG